MKIKFSHIIRSLIFILFISLTSCEKELYEDSIQNSSRNLTVQHIKLNDIDKAISTKIENKISAIKKTKELKNNVDEVENRFEYNSTLDIYIDTENGKLINNNGDISYTFPMFRRSEEKLENIVFKQKQDGSLDTFFAKYNIKPEEFINLTLNEKSNLKPDLYRVYSQGFDLIVQYVCVNIYYTITTYGTCPYPDGYHPESGLQCDAEVATHSLSFCNVTTSEGGGGSNPNNGNTGGNTGSDDDGIGTGSNGVSTSPTTMSPEQAAIKEFVMNSLNEEQNNWYSNQNPAVQLSINSLILSLGVDNNCISGESAALELINFCLEYNDESEESQQNAVDAIQSLINDCEDNNPDNSSNILLGPSCESFNFTRSGNLNWQQAAVKNIKFRVVLINQNGIFNHHDIRFSTPTLFGLPVNTIMYGDISPGFAAELSAQAISISMSETVAMYGNQAVSETVVRYYFISRLKHNYQIMTNGGRVNFNMQNSPVTPTEYLTNAFGTGNCDD